ncbi:MAG TPA: valine--tRNA ligase [Planctomycetota bacterium]|nr:valine--tRNA ligase [Planctomycetota bacterium]
MELGKTFDPKLYEATLYAAWQSSGGFAPRAPGPGTKGPFTIMIPPPNVTGVLHMGHALNNTIQDIVIRHRRMDGYEALWLPGTDHAGIATQAVVEKKLQKEQGKKREALGREAFVAEVWKWKEEHGTAILEQLRRLGSSCDWSRTRFTLEEDMSRAVREAFVRLWEKGLIYRGARLVNWDCVLETAVSDDEIEMVTRKDKLYYLRYPVEGHTGRTVTVATTRPETMVGDTGVAVHPTDARYHDLIGGHLILPLISRRIPIVADDTVDPKFGTGAVKITPGHDPADYERGQRFNLPIVSVLTKDGKLNEEGGPFAGMPREKARTAILAALEEHGLVEKSEDLEHNVPISDRSKSVIEPIVSEQWFVRMQPLAAPAIEAVESGRLRFVPERWTKVYLDWLVNVRDWCISRQLWWGHRIPVWYDEDSVPFASRTDLELGSIHPITKKPIVRQDEDVLDTWASSYLWPFATLGWPKPTADLARFYPTQFLSTARDIIYLWVARMVMAGYEFVDPKDVRKSADGADPRCPFSVVNIHATVLDAQGRRMSKSLGNGIDPIEMIDKYGADAVRFSLILLTNEGQDVKLSPDRFDQGFRFGNKVWNASKFVLANLDGAPGEVSADPASFEALEDQWIVARRNATLASVSAALDEYRFNDAATELYAFIWNDFCDWYLELAKGRFTTTGTESARTARGVLVSVLSDTLAMLHPFMPYITEALWAALHEKLGRTGPMLMNSPWPTSRGAAAGPWMEAMESIQALVRAVRNVRAMTMVGERAPLAALVVAKRASDRELLTRHQKTATTIAFLSELRVVESAERPPASAVAVAGAIEVFVPLSSDVDLSKLKDVLERRLAKGKSALEAVDKKLANAAFVEKADAQIVAAERQRREEIRLENELIARNLAGM